MSLKEDQRQTTPIEQHEFKVIVFQDSRDNSIATTRFYCQRHQQIKKMTEGEPGSEVTSDVVVSPMPYECMKALEELIQHRLINGWSISK